MTDHAGELLGTFDVVFDDGSGLAISVYREERRVRFQWPNQGGIPNEHMVRVVNEGRRSAARWRRKRSNRRSGSAKSAAASTCSADG